MSYDQKSKQTNKQKNIDAFLYWYGFKTFQISVSVKVVPEKGFKVRFQWKWSQRKVSGLVLVKVVLEKGFKVRFQKKWFPEKGFKVRFQWKWSRRKVSGSVSVKLVAGERFSVQFQWKWSRRNVSRFVFCESGSRRKVLRFGFSESGFLKKRSMNTQHNYNIHDITKVK